jgi:glycosyltransferase involved in cell wall biosynthesis
VVYFGAAKEIGDLFDSEQKKKVIESSKFICTFVSSQWELNFVTSCFNHFQTKGGKNSKYYELIIVQEESFVVENENAIILKHLKEGQKNLVLKSSKFLLIPNLKEDSDKLILRAMLLGCIVVSSNTSFALEMVCHEYTGLLLPVKPSLWA